MNSDLHPSGASPRREELMREQEGHPTPERIATLLDPTGPLTDEAELRAHLACCRRCFGLYLEMAEQQLTWQHSTETDEVPADLVRAAKDLAEPPAQAEEEPAAAVGTGRTHRTGSWMAIAAVLIAASLLWLVPRQIQENAKLVPVRRAVSEASLASMVLTQDVASPGPVMRSGSGSNPALRRSLDALARDFDDPRASETIAYWYCAGMLADEDGHARMVVEDATLRFPNSVPIANLAAVAAYRAGDFAGANQRLRGILASHPAEPVALFNRTVVLKEHGPRVEYEQSRAELLATLDHASQLRELAVHTFPGD